jgi:3'-5' exonuclease
LSRPVRPHFEVRRAAASKGPAALLLFQRPAAPDQHQLIGLPPHQRQRPHSSYLRPVCRSILSSDALRAPRVGERTEKQLIAAFCDKIAELKPQLVTFNGNSFDLPVLRYRAMIHGVSAPGLAARLYFNRYTEDAVDLCDILSSFAPHTKASLNELSKIMGLPGKPDGLDGSEVERYFLEGRIKEIADYCEVDVVNTYRVWLRYELFRGRLTEREHQASERSLADFVRARANGERPLR